MTTVLHPLLHVDILEAMQFYEREGGGELAADFLYEYERTLQKILECPLSFPSSDEVLRRAMFDRFPFHILSASNRPIFLSSPSDTSGAIRTLVSIGNTGPSSNNPISFQRHPPVHRILAALPRESIPRTIRAGIPSRSVTVFARRFGGCNRSASAGR